MNAVIAERTYSPEDLLRMPDGNRYELVDGELVERPMSAWSSYVAGRVYRLVANFCEPIRLGWTFPEGTSYQCFADAPTKVRNRMCRFFAATDSVQRKRWPKATSRLRRTPPLKSFRPMMCSTRWIVGWESS